MKDAADYKPFEHTGCPNIKSLSPGEIPLISLPLGTRKLSVANSPTKTAQIDVVGDGFIPYEFILFQQSPKDESISLIDLYSKAEQKLLNDLYPGVDPKELWISHRGGWFHNDYASTICVSIVHIPKEST